LEQNDIHKMEICAPFLDLTKANIVKIGIDNDVPFEDTWSCYKGETHECGKCGTCLERIAAFKENGIEDPIKCEEK